MTQFTEMKSEQVFQELKTYYRIRVVDVPPQKKNMRWAEIKEILRRGENFQTGTCTPNFF